MTKFQFRERIPIDVEHTLGQLLSRFQGVRDGLPELIKNAKDQYSRLGITDRASRVVLVVVNTRQKALAVIDFAGAAAEQFKRWETWSDPNANTKDKAGDIEGGHGNGGKAFMVLGSTSDASFESCFSGRRTRMGYVETERFKPGIALEEGKPIEDVAVDSPREQFDKALANLGITYGQLPPQARAAFETRGAYTVAQVNGVRDWARPRPETVRRLAFEIPRAIEVHPQAAQSLESCDIWFVLNGTILSEAPARIRYPDPFPGFPEPRALTVPFELTDPGTRETVRTTLEGGELGEMILRTSVRSLRTEDMRPMHLIRVRNGRNVVGLWSVSDLSPGASSGFIFGEIRLAALVGEHLAGADRQSLNDTPLVRALQEWAAQQVKDLADDIQQATAKEHRPEDRDKVNHSLNRLRDLMRPFILERNRGTTGSAVGQVGDGTDGIKPPPAPPPLPGSRIDIVEIEGGSASIAMAVGANLPLRIKAFEQAPTGELLVVASPTLIAVTDSRRISIDGEFQITAIAAGPSDLHFVTPDGGTKSNSIRIDAASCTGALFAEIPDRSLLQGEHLALKITYITQAGVRDDMIHDASVDEIGMGRISRIGNYVAGTQEGTATVRVRWGPRPVDTASASLRIGVERVPQRPGKGGNAGGDVPLILLCGTPVPGMDQYPLDQRTIPPSEHQPTIIDFDPSFDNVIFINPDSKESIQARKGRGGRKGMAGIATETYYQFIALKCFEILKRLWVFERAKEAPLYELQFRERFATAETECAPFIEEAYRVAEAIAEASTKGAS